MYSPLPTIPQVFIGGELIGGADITEELVESGELEEKLESALGAGYRSVRGSKPEWCQNPGSARNPSFDTLHA